MSETDFSSLNKTPNLNLYKPSYDNICDVEVLNANADILDTKIKEMFDSIDFSNCVTLDTTQTITSQKTFDVPQVMNKGLLIPATQSLTWFNGSPNRIAGVLNQSNYSGNASTATKLQNAITINGVDFDGTTNITTSSFNDVSAKGKTLTFTSADGTTKSVDTQDTTYTNATTSKNGLLSTDDKKKLDSITANAAYKLPYATCTSGSTTTAKVATVTNSVKFELVAGSVVLISASYSFLGAIVAIRT